jgi:hypothetical protein
MGAAQSGFLSIAYLVNISMFLLHHPVESMQKFAFIIRFCFYED